MRAELASTRHEILVAPAVLYETARTPDLNIRHAILKVMLAPPWKRLMPEAYSEAEELKNEIKRLRPEWLRKPPDTVLFKRLRYDWRRTHGGQWDRIMNDAPLLEEHSASMIEAAREGAEVGRQDSMDWPSSWRNNPLSAMTAQQLPAPVEPTVEKFEPWRFAGMMSLKQIANMDGHATVEWLDGEIDLAWMHFDPQSLESFWLSEVGLERMPRHWLRWAFEFLQRQYKVTPGTPGDAQLGTYLVDADLLLSADENLIRMAIKCRHDAPSKLAESHRIAGGDAAADDLVNILRTRSFVAR